MGVQGVTKTSGSKQTQGESKGVSHIWSRGRGLKGRSPLKVGTCLSELMSQPTARRGDTQASHLGEGLGLELVIAGTLDVFCLGTLEPWWVGWGDSDTSLNPELVQWQKSATRWQHLLVNPNRQVCACQADSKEGTPTTCARGGGGGEGACRRRDT